MAQAGIIVRRRVGFHRRGSKSPSAHSLYNSCKASVKLQVLHTSCKAPAKAAALKKATDLSQLLCRRYTPPKSRNVLKPTREHRPEVPHAVLPSRQRVCALAAAGPFGPPWAPQIHSKSHRRAHCAQRCARERPKTRKNGPLGAQGCQKVPKLS